MAKALADVVRAYFFATIYSYLPPFCHQLKQISVSVARIKMLNNATKPHKISLLRTYKA